MMSTCRHCKARFVLRNGHCPRCRRELAPGWQSAETERLALQLLNQISLLEGPLFALQRVSIEKGN
jgi:hypothetical protein